MKRTTVQLTQAQYAGVLRLARERHGGNTSAALREVLAAGVALLDGGADEGAQLAGLRGAAAKAAWDEGAISAGRRVKEHLNSALGRLAEAMTP